MEHEELTYAIIGCFYCVYNELGYGFLENVYVKALVYELYEKGLNVQQQVPINVYYKNITVGEYVADIIINNEIIIEVKAVENISRFHEALLLNYLKATNKKLGFLFNFGKEAKYIRRIL